MQINQFSIIKTTPEERVSELRRLRLLEEGDEALPGSELFHRLLLRTHLATQAPAGQDVWLRDLLATPTTDLKQWLTSGAELTDAVFYLVALQLLGYEPARDFPLDYPLLGIKRLHLPHAYHEDWDAAAVIEGFYLLLLTRGPYGMSFLDLLTSQGLLTWSYELPASEKPLFFNGKPVACFDPHRFIREVVYVETAVDTDRDGKADLVKAEIMRPVESNQGLAVPALFTASPYNQGTNDEWGEKITHDVNHPLTHKAPATGGPDIPPFPTTMSHQEVHGAGPATETFAATPAYTLNDYLATRGYAVVYSSGIGTKDSDGLETCGSPEQTAAMQAVVEWLHGDRVAFTDRTSGIAVRADWCNGRVAMTGRSYLGTLATAVATTGVAGLKAIISEAAISSWYDYYRENGLVMAPGGFQGEDADVLAAETFSRTKRAADYRRIEPTNREYLKQMTAAQDRASGNYNDFWAQRDYRPFLKNIQCAVMMVHGLNDENVKPNQVKAVDTALAKMPNPTHLILHQGRHIYINAFRSLDFSEMVNLWLADKLWGVKNGADAQLPRVLVQDNATAEDWRAAERWDGRLKMTYHLHEGTLSKQAATPAPVRTFNDQQDPAVYQDWCKHPAKWRTALLNDRAGKFSTRFSTAPLPGDLILKGTPTVRVAVTATADHGLLSAFLVDEGTAKRLTTNPVVLAKNALQLGHQWEKDDLREFQAQKEPSPYKVISFGHLNLQNRHNPAQVDDYQPGQKVTVDLALQPVFHRLLPGHRLTLILFSTDYLMTLRGNEAITYTVDPTSLTLAVGADFA